MINPTLWQQLKDGQTIAMKTLYQEAYQDLYSFGFRITADKEKVKDAIHEMFCEIWQNRKTINEVHNVSSYLKTYLKRKLLKDVLANSLVVNEEILDSHFFKNTYSHEYLMIESQTSNEMKRKLYDALNQLTDTQRDIIELKFFGDYNYEQISGFLNIKVRTIYNHVYEAMVTLKKNLK